MLRTAILRSIRGAARLNVPKHSSCSRPARASSFLQSSHFTPIASLQTVRCYSAPAGLAKPEVEGRIIDLLKNFDKVRIFVCAPYTPLTPGRSTILQRYCSIHQQSFVALGSNDWQISTSSHFANDLGLDSLDTVEVVMAIEEVQRSDGHLLQRRLTSCQEFSIEIPDKEADAIHSGRPSLGHCFGKMANKRCS